MIIFHFALQFFWGTVHKYTEHFLYNEKDCTNVLVHSTCCSLSPFWGSAAVVVAVALLCSSPRN